MIQLLKQLFGFFNKKQKVAPQPVKVVPITAAIPSKSLTQEEKFQKELDKLGIKHFTAKEVFFRGASDKKLNLNTEPPEILWNNIWETIKIADKAREAHGKPIKINSAYRSPKYNKAVGGASRSFHTKFNALDLRTSAPKQLHKALLDLRNKGLFKGGLGLYKTFVHVDTRGYNADWRG